MKRTNLSLRLGLGLAGAALLLSGCGGDSGYNSYPTPAPPVVTPPVVTPPAPVLDAFFSSVKTSLATAPDDAEPASIDAAVATMPEDSEPAEL